MLTLRKKNLLTGKDFEEAAGSWKKGNLFSSDDGTQRLGSLRIMGGLWPIHTQQGLQGQQNSRWGPQCLPKDPLPEQRSRSWCLA